MASLLLCRPPHAELVTITAGQANLDFDQRATARALGHEPVAPPGDAHAELKAIAGAAAGDVLIKLYSSNIVCQECQKADLRGGEVVGKRYILWPPP